MTDAERREKNDEELMKLGVQYYVAARSAALVGATLMPVCGNLYHHALEMFLKAPAPQNERPRPVPIWDAFKAEFPSTALLQFNDNCRHSEI
jgi:hypothetical protein